MPCRFNYVLRNIVLFIKIGRDIVCLMQIQIIDYDSFSRRQIVLPHILHHIKIRVIEGVFLLLLDSIEGGAAGCGLRCVYGESWLMI